MKSIYKESGLKNTIFFVNWAYPICSREDSSFGPVGVLSAAILGWWQVGVSENGEPFLFAAVRADGRDEVENVIKTNWPIFNGEFRFVQAHRRRWVPSDRFPLEPWMAERFAENQMQ